MKSVKECSDECIANKGADCKFFIYGKDGTEVNKTGQCWWEESCDTFVKDSYDVYQNTDEVSALKFIINKAIYIDKTQQTLEQDIKEYNNSVNQPETSPHMDYLSSFKNSYI